MKYTILLFVFISNALFAQTINRGPYLQMGTSTSMQIRWRSDVATESRILYGTNQNLLSEIALDASLTTEHILNLSNLQSNTKYYYAIYNNTTRLEGSSLNYFITAPPIGSTQKTRIWATGDCGTGSSVQTNVQNTFLNFLGNNYVNAWILLGDNAYTSGLDTEYQNKFFAPYQSQRLMKQTPIFPAPGNHDYANSAALQDSHQMPYYDIFSMPTTAEIGGIASNTEAFYSYNIANIHFVSIDSYGKENGTRLSDTLSSPQITWLKQDLAANQQTWTILYWHHPPYTMGSHNSDTESELRYIREKVMPILDRYKVDLVLCGHSHCYERSKPTRGHYGLEASFDSTAHHKSFSSGRYDGSSNSCPYIKTSGSTHEGIIYVVAGSAGQISGNQTSFPHNAMYYSNNTNGGSLYLEIENKRLDAKWIATNGVILDKFTILKDANKSSIVNLPNNATGAILTAPSPSWQGSYFWQHDLSNNQTITINNPQNGMNFLIKDSLACMADTIKISMLNDCLNQQNITTMIENGSNIKVETSHYITAESAILNKSAVVYDAGQSIILNAGFVANKGAIFSAYIDGCGNSSTYIKH